MNRVSSVFKKGNLKRNKLVYITHGFREDGKSMTKMKNNILGNYGEGNTVVGMVVWKHGARTWGVGKWSRRDLFWTQGWNRVKQWVSNKLSKSVNCCKKSGTGIRYGEAAMNTWPVGNILAYVNERIVGARKGKRFKTMCIGFSLGAHQCGFFGKMSKKLSQHLTLDKIVGLDPAGPIWDWTSQDPNLRLNKKDAFHVEVLHTNTKTYGYKDPLGDLDFYLNGGDSQPGCNYWKNIAACSHKMAKNFFTALNGRNSRSTSCYAKDKCRITDGSQLQDIENRSYLLTSKGCFTSSRVKVGDLDGNDKGVYWIDADKSSATCYYNQ